MIYSFRSVVQGNHTLFREYSYIRKTPHNIASFIRVFWKCFRHIGRNGGIVINQNVVDTLLEIVGFWNTFICSLFDKVMKLNSVAYKWRHKIFNPWCDSDKQTIPWATSLRVTINFAIRWPLQLKMLEKTHNMYLGIIITQSLKEGGKIWWAWSHVWRLFTNTLLTSRAEKKYYFCTRHSGVSLTRK